MSSCISYQFAVVPVAMTNSVKLFQAAQQYMRITGIYPPQPGQIHSFNAKNVGFLFCLFVIFVLVSSFFLFQAKSAVEFSISFYSSVTLLTTIALLILHICKAPRSFEMLHSMKEFIEKSEWISARFTFQKHPIQLHLVLRNTKFKVNISI